MIFVYAFHQVTRLPAKLAQVHDTGSATSPNPFSFSDTNCGIPNKLAIKNEPDCRPSQDKSNFSYYPFKKYVESESFFFQFAVQA